jgi:4-hydroxy-3-methylbut-2-enyl diphosphate reductase
MSEPGAVDAAHVRKGFGLRAEVRQALKSLYASALIDYFKRHGHRLEAGEMSLRLAREFGFCYGVDRAVEYAYETRQKFPDRRIFLTGEIIHNPHVNERLSEMGIEFLSGARAVAGGFAAVTAKDVVIVPAFGLPVKDFELLASRGCTLVDTTCGSVLNVWKNVERYGREGFTAVIHGKFDHEETLATASRASITGGRYLILRDLAEAEEVAQFIERDGDEEALRRRFERVASAGFEPGRDLQRIGLANQTTMLSSESLAIERRLREAMERRRGAAALAERFRAFDTICSATQDRQDAVLELCREGVDLMLVIGGFNSSNTTHLVEIANHHTRAYHIEDASSLLSTAEIRHKPEGQPETVVSKHWLESGCLRVGVTAGASTPNNRVGEVVERLLELRGVDLAALDLGPASPASRPA